MTSTVNAGDRPITRSDLEAKLGQIRDATEGGAARSRTVGIAVGVVVVAAVVAGAFLLGNRRGKKRRTLVEIRRI